MHCIDSIRQSIQCKADLTIIPTQWQPGLGENYIDADREHECRDFEKVKKWELSRYDGPLAVKPRHPDGSVRVEPFNRLEAGQSPVPRGK